MDQIKIGKFIKERRKEKKITQDDLADKLGVTNRAISKWENGNCMPDSGLIPELCKLLGITINDLFHGKVVDKKDNDKQLEKYLLEIYKQKELGDKKLLNFEVVVGIVFVAYFLFIILTLSSLVEKSLIPEGIFLLITVVSVIFIIIMGCVLLRIEQIAGYYECNKCHHKYIPSYKNITLAPHMNRTRYMRCPKCNNKSWHKKVLSKGDDYD